eukprot:15366831-Ditylum_brightwellii.AAC.2
MSEVLFPLGPEIVLPLRPKVLFLHVEWLLDLKYWLPLEPVNPSLYHVWYAPSSWMRKGTKECYLVNGMQIIEDQKDSPNSGDCSSEGQCIIASSNGSKVAVKDNMPSGHDILCREVAYEDHLQGMLSRETKELAMGMLRHPTGYLDTILQMWFQNISWRPQNMDTFQQGGWQCGLCKKLERS